MQSIRVTTVSKIAYLLIPIALLVLGSYGFSSGGQLSDVAMGDSQGKVIRLMGQPDQVVIEPNARYCNDRSTTHEYWYGSAIFASWDVVGLNAADTVTCTLHLDSP